MTVCMGGTSTAVYQPTSLVSISTYLWLDCWVVFLLWYLCLYVWLHISMRVGNRWLWKIQHAINHCLTLCSKKICHFFIFPRIFSNINIIYILVKSTQKNNHSFFLKFKQSSCNQTRHLNHQLVQRWRWTTNFWKVFHDLCLNQDLRRNLRQNLQQNLHQELHQINRRMLWVGY